MKRLTEKFRDGYTYSIKRKDMNIHGDSLIGEFPDKLGQLEDYEDELGIGLITLFKALDNGIYYRKENDIYKIDINYICKNKLGYIGYSLGAYDDDYPDIDIWFLFKDYGKTWALTKDELC